MSDGLQRKSLSMSQTASFTVDGMTCASCVGRVERSLSTLPGVEAVSVNLVSGKAQVTFAERPDAEAVAAALGKAGYPLATEETRLSVEGMTCASCVGRVERALKAAPGVLAASVNLATNEAAVRFAAGATSPGELAAVVTKAGYAARPKHDEAPAAATDRQVAEQAGLTRSFWLSAVLTLPVVALAMGVHAVPALHHWQIGRAHV